MRAELVDGRLGDTIGGWYPGFAAGENQLYQAVECPHHNEAVSKGIFHNQVREIGSRAETAAEFDLHDGMN